MLDTPRERIWTRIYVDRMKLTSLSGYLAPQEKKDELGVKAWLKGPDSRFDLERVFAKLSPNELLSDTRIDEIVDQLVASRKAESVGKTITRLLDDQESGDSKRSPKGELVLLEATNPVLEGLRIPRPDGSTLPVLKQGSYIAYRKPFDKLLLFDGTYHSGVLMDFTDLSSYDLLKVYLKQSDEVDPRALLESWDNSHARIVGLLGTCPPYECRYRTSLQDQPKSRISFGLFALVIDVSSLDNLDLAQRMHQWRLL